MIEKYKKLILAKFVKKHNASTASFPNSKIKDSGKRTEKDIPLSNGERFTYPPECGQVTHKKMFFHTKTPVLRKKIAFTLAEILITITIVGVVSIMVLPLLRQAYFNHITEVRLKKFYSTFNNTLKLSELDNGDKVYWDDYWYLSKTNNCSADKILKIIKKYISPYLKISRIETIDTKPFFILSDGSAFSYTTNLYIREIDYYPNKYKKHAKWSKRKPGENVFVFEFLECTTYEGCGTGWQHVSGKGLVPYLYSWNGNYEQLEQNCKTTGNFCTELIKRNNWKIPKNYPLKIRY